MVRRITCPHGITPKSKCKKCLAEYSRQYRIKHPDKVKESFKKWYNKCGTKVRREWRNQNREKVRKSSRRRYHENIVHYRQYAKNWKRKQREEIKRKLGSKCVICGKTEKLVAHEVHGKPHNQTKYWFTLKHIEDFVLLCKKHHEMVHALAKLTELQVEKALQFAKKITR